MVGAEDTAIDRLVGAAAARSAGGAVAARPVTGRRVGAEIETGCRHVRAARLDHYNARAALPLNRIGPVGRPMGEPPSGSSVISNS
jgi:hypothetical protein